jgi:hypothetical protein
MKTWLDFESRFRGLSSVLQHARIDDQSGSAGEYWRIAGITSNSEAIRQFELLCNISGQQITELQACSDEILNHEDPKIRWYRLLKNTSAIYERDNPAYKCDDEGNNLGWLYGGTISNICESSANLCLQLHSSHPIKLKWHEVLYQDYGKQVIIGIILLIIGGFIGAWFK